MSPPDVAFRPATTHDEPFLRRMLWIAAHWDQPDPAPPDVALPTELARYTDGFGRSGDRGYVATREGASVAAAWCRRLTPPDSGYGYVADDVPELSVAVSPDSRRRGIAAGLIELLLADLEGEAPAVSLSVEPRNPARLLYERLGFVKVARNGEAWTMVRSLTPP
ncbi:MAG: GNAT family N-acetyltransferase [Solirubrobacteraceae bacterium]